MDKSPVLDPQEKRATPVQTTGDRTFRPIASSSSQALLGLVCYSLSGKNVHKVSQCTDNKAVKDKRRLVVILKPIISFVFYKWIINVIH